MIHMSMEFLCKQMSPVNVHELCLFSFRNNFSGRVGSRGGRQQKTTLSAVDLDKQLINYRVCDIGYRFSNCNYCIHILYRYSTYNLLETFKVDFYIVFCNKNPLFKKRL